jgi:tetratricopeptide (TPR) repeat protein
MKTFERILRLDSSSHVSKSEIAWIHFAKGIYDEARRLISEALEIFPQNALYHYRIGRIYWSMDGR